MGLRVIFVFTHDSIGLGEDGPTHQPVEQIMNLRTVPNVTVIRPAAANDLHRQASVLDQPPSIHQHRERRPSLLKALFLISQ